MAGQARHRAFGIDSMRPGPEGKVNLLVQQGGVSPSISHPSRAVQSEALLGAGPFTFIGPADEVGDGTLADPRRGRVRYVKQTSAKDNRPGAQATQAGRNPMSIKNPRTDRAARFEGLGFLTGAAVASSFGRPLRQRRAIQRPVKIIVARRASRADRHHGGILVAHLADAIGGTLIVENKPAPAAIRDRCCGARRAGRPHAADRLERLRPSIPVLRQIYDPYTDFAPIAELRTSPT